VLPDVDAAIHSAHDSVIFRATPGVFSRFLRLMCANIVDIRRSETFDFTNRQSDE